LGGGCQVPIGIYCRASLETSLDQASWEGACDEIFGVVANPETGAAVRIYHRAPHSDSDPVTLGLLAAHKLLEAGAGPLLEAADGTAR